MPSSSRMVCGNAENSYVLNKRQFKGVRLQFLTYISDSTNKN